MTDVSPAPPLLARFPEQSYGRLIVWYPESSELELADRYAEAAERLKESFSGGASDDQMLMPWLYLQRHIAELTLKGVIVFVAGLRNSVTGDPSLGPEPIRDRMRDKMGHSLAKLAAELNMHLEALNAAAIPDDIMSLLGDLDDLDPGGTSLRYTNGASNRIDRNGFRLDFLSLAEALETMNGMLGAIIDVTGGGY